jgi:EpsI family protein
MLRLAGNFGVVVVLMGLVAGAVALAPPRSLGRSMLSACPLSISGLEGRDEPIENFVLEELDPSEMIIRTYSGPNPLENVWLVVSYFENARYGAHDPKVCYRSQGWAVEDVPDLVVPRPSRGALAARSFVVKRRGDAHLVAYFWYISDDKVTGDHRRFLDSMALQGILRGSNYGSFVRVSTPMLPTPEAAAARLTRFSEEVLAMLPSLFHEDGEGRRG